MSKKLRSEMLAAVGTSRLQEKKNYHRAIKKSRNYPFLCRSSFTIANDKGPTLPGLSWKSNHLGNNPLSKSQAN